MKLEVGKVYKVIDVPQSEVCLNCTPCLRLKMMDMGFICGEKIRIKRYSSGIWLVGILTEMGNECSSIALRDEEMERIVLEEFMV